jgi:hypothetical protein
VEQGTNTLVLGGNRQRRRGIVREACASCSASRQRQYETTTSETVHELEALEKKPGEFLVVIHDAHRIDPRRLWQIRSVAQLQRNVTYIFEGAHRNRMFDMVIRYDAAFYRQLQIVDIDRPPPRPR